MIFDEMMNMKGGIICTPTIEWSSHFSIAYWIKTN